MTITYVMGVSGVGKSTVAKAMARQLGARLLEGDDYHPAENIARMSAGKPLTDAMRVPWLATVRAAAEQAAARGDVVVACSGLKAAYRALLAGPDVVMVMLTGDAQTIRARMAARTDHYMPGALLDSQLATLELPEAGEPGVICVDADAPPDKVLQRAMSARATLLRTRAQPRK
ncbi:gluconokinase [Aliiroseovarius sp. PTFE2010]|uniref:gluconokinase n=1 Tax=Aliiroseovarius sp. PTFE2010 TaxID=3417190 RepID=UPI003CF3689D